MQFLLKRVYKKIFGKKNQKLAVLCLKKTFMPLIWPRAFYSYQLLSERKSRVVPDTKSDFPQSILGFFYCVQILKTQIVLLQIHLYSGTILCKRRKESIPCMNRDLDIRENVEYFGKIGESVWLKSCAS